MRNGTVVGALILAGLLRGSELGAAGQAEGQVADLEGDLREAVERARATVSEATIDLRVRHIIAKTLTIGLERVTEQARFVEDLGMDSLDAIDLVLALEEEFGIKISDEQARQLRTVGQAIAFVRTQVERL